MIALSSCDFVGDSGCCDPDCWHAIIATQQALYEHQRVVTTAAPCIAPPPAQLQRLRREVLPVKECRSLSRESQLFSLKLKILFGMALMPVAVTEILRYLVSGHG